MAKAEPEPKPELKEWTPDQPLPDEEDENEVQRRHAAQRRLKYLDEQADKKTKPGKPEKPERRKLFAV